MKKIESSFEGKEAKTKTVNFSVGSRRLLEK